jgi:hypothetical protein
MKACQIFRRSLIEQFYLRRRIRIAGAGKKARRHPDGEDGLAFL